MKTPTVQTFVIADPNSARRKMIVAACEGRTDLLAIGVSTSGEAYRHIEQLSPRFIAVAVEFARLQEFAGLSGLLQLIKADVVIHGAPPFPDVPYPHVEIHAGDGAGALLKALLPTQEARRAVSPPPARLTRLSTPRPSEPQARHVSNRNDGPDIIGIGASTGGIAAIETILSAFPADCPPTLVVQHIRTGYADGFVRRLDMMVAPTVVPAIDGAELQRGRVYVATRPEQHLGLVARAGLRVRYVDAPEVARHRPSIDVLFESLAALTEWYRISVALLTGMGSDGANGMVSLRQKNAFTVAQDRISSVVWGMPQAAIQRGGASVVLPLDQIAAAILTCKTAALRRESGVRC
jgi:two-component system chemotaxis response regulator CheB